MELKLFHFFPQSLNLYGDIGNIIALNKRCEWLGIHLNIINIENIDDIELSNADIIYIGNGKEKEEQFITPELLKIQKELKSAIEDEITMLAIGSGYKLLGEFYENSKNQRIKGLNVLEIHSIKKDNPFYGDTILESSQFGKVIGFKNHYEKIYHSYEPLGNVLTGNGNNDEDKKEGLQYKNLIGTYLQGPLLPKNPLIADSIIIKAIERKYGKELNPLKDTHIETRARKNIIKKYLI